MVVTHKSSLTCTPIHKCTVKHMMTHKNPLTCTPNTQTYGHKRMHTYVYIHACTNGDTCACILIYSHTWHIRTNKCGYSHIPYGYKHKHTHRHACTVTHAQSHTYKHMYMHTHRCACTHTHTHANTPAHTHMHQHTHTHIY